MSPSYSIYFRFAIALLIGALFVSGYSGSGDSQSPSETEVGNPDGSADGTTGADDTVGSVQASLELVNDKTFRIS